MAAFSAAFGHLPPHEQCMVDALAPAGRQAAFWAEVEGAATRRWEVAVDRPRAPHRAARRPLRAVYRITAWFAGVGS